MLREYFGLILDGMNAFMDNSYQSFIDSFRPFAILILTTYILISAILIFTGKTEKPKEMLWTALATIIISGLVFKYDTYKTYMVDTVIDQTMNLMGFFVGKATATTNASQFFEAMDINFAQIFNMLNLKNDNVGWTTGWEINLLIFLLTMVYSALYIIFSIIIITAFFALYVFFIIGGIPLFLAILPSTRFIFWAWLRAIATYALIPVFASIVMGISLSFIAEVAQNLKAINLEEAGVFNEITGRAFFVALLTIFFLFKCSEFAAALTGGQPSSISAFMGSAISIGALSTMPAARALAPKIATGIKDRSALIGQDISRLFSKMRGL